MGIQIWPLLGGDVWRSYTRSDSCVTEFTRRCTGIHDPDGPDAPHGFTVRTPSFQETIFYMH